MKCPLPLLSLVLSAILCLNQMDPNRTKANRKNIKKIKKDLPAVREGGEKEGEEEVPVEDTSAEMREREEVKRRKKNTKEEEEGGTGTGIGKNVMEKEEERHRYRDRDRDKDQDCVCVCYLPVLSPLRPNGQGMTSRRLGRGEGIHPPLSCPLVFAPMSSY